MQAVLTEGQTMVLNKSRIELDDYDQVLLWKRLRFVQHQCSHWGAQMHSTTRPSAQWTLILAHLQLSKI